LQDWCCQSQQCIWPPPSCSDYLLTTRSCLQAQSHCSISWQLLPLSCLRAALRQSTRCGHCVPNKSFPGRRILPYRPISNLFSCANLEREIQEEVRPPEILIYAVALAGSAPPRFALAYTAEAAPAAVVPRWTPDRPVLGRRGAIQDSGNGVIPRT
jgi:hypothetical protein